MKAPLKKPSISMLQLHKVLQIVSKSEPAAEPQVDAEPEPERKCTEKAGHWSHVIVSSSPVFSQSLLSECYRDL